MSPENPAESHLDGSAVRQALMTIIDPEHGKDLMSLGLVDSVQVEGGTITVTIAGPTQDEANQARLTQAIEQAITCIAEERGATLDAVDVAFATRVRIAEQGPEQPPSALPDVKHIIAVGAGKGGVGKSTVSVCLAMALARQGASVGLLDGDIYGPSIPTMLGLEDAVPQVRGSTMLPFEAHGIKSVSIGKLVDPDKALIWRGPMAHGAFKQLALQTDWGALDYLLVDLPPGTGDVPLTLAQLLPLTGAVLVCTPQRVAQEDARRAGRMFQQLDVEILGVIENMSSFTGDDGKEYDLFGKGGAEILARTMGLPFLGSLPIHPSLRMNLDAGTPDANWDDDAALGRALDALAASVADQVQIAGNTPPTLEIN